MFIDEAKSKVLQFRKAISDLEKGIEVDEDSLPQKLTPDFICGCSQKERITEFLKLIKYFIERKKGYQIKLNEYVTKSKQMDKKEFLKNVIFD